MSKIINFNIEARNKLKRGLDILANSVKVTLGPKGRNVVIGKKYGAPHITKDGVSVAKEVELKDPIENLGAQLIKQVSSKTGNDAGDGTTTATVLAQAIVTEGLRNVTAGASPIDLKRGIDKAVEAVVAYIKKVTKTIGDDYDLIEKVATISANNEPEIGKLVADCFRKVSKDGVITIEEGQSNETYIEVVDGMQFNRGFLSSYFVNNTEKMECILENPYILIVDEKLQNVKDILSILTAILQKNESLLIVADEVDSEVTSTLVMNCLQRHLKVCVVKSPGFGDSKREYLEDLAVLTGSKIISESIGLKLSDATVTELGRCEKAIITKDSTTIVNGAGDETAIALRAKEIKAQIESNPANKEKLQERLAKLAGGVAVLYVGANSEVEIKEKKDRVEDALCATRAALEEGIVAGGGSTYIHAIESAMLAKNSTHDELIGNQIVVRALEEPLRQICSNAGKEGAVVVAEVKNGEYGYGYNAKDNRYEYLLDSGVIDPAKVTRCALENAASIAGLLLTTECVIVDDPDTVEQKLAY